MSPRVLAIVLFSARLLAAQNTCAWAEAPFIAIGNLEPGKGFRARTITISRWLKGEGPRQLQLAFLTSRVEPGEFVFYGHRIESDVFDAVILRSAATLDEDEKLIATLKQERNVVRGRFIAEPNSNVDWGQAAVQLSGKQTTVTAKLDANGRFEQRGLAAGVYAINLTTLPTTPVKQPTTLHVNVPDKGCADPVLVVYRDTVIDKVRERVESLSSWLRAFKEVVAESVIDSRR